MRNAKTISLIESRFVAKPPIYKDAYASSNEVATSIEGFCGNRSKQLSQLYYNWNCCSQGNLCSTI